MIKNKTPLSLIRKVIDKLEETKYFKTNQSLFELKLIYFGLYNLAGTFQQIINSIFQELLYKGVLANYMDNFIIPTKTKKKLEKHIIQFLKVAEKYNLCFK